MNAGGVGQAPKRPYGLLVSHPQPVQYLISRFVPQIRMSRFGRDTPRTKGGAIPVNTDKNIFLSDGFLALVHLRNHASGRYMSKPDADKKRHREAL